MKCVNLASDGGANGRYDFEEAFGVGEMVWWGKCLMCKYEDLSLDF